MAKLQHTSQPSRFQLPRGMRDFYPADMAVRRYIEGVWREVSINHGFEEIEGPMFEHTELYTHKSGPGIVNELFQVFSGKDEAEIEQIRQGKDAPYALRPEFTPTLARMVAARAAQLPKPIKWFSIPAHFRAERPQRGRLREFMQWNVDFIGGEVDPAKADAEVIAVAVAALEHLGLTHEGVTVRVSDRDVVSDLLKRQGVSDEHLPHAFEFLDKRSKLSSAAPEQLHHQAGFDVASFDNDAERWTFLVQEGGVQKFSAGVEGLPPTENLDFMPMRRLFECLKDFGINQWASPDFGIVRGLAYYTGTVFEIIAEGERAIAGGGRYDNLIESFGGPSMPACGFGMGDVVLGLLLHEKGLLPEDVYMRELRPHAFVVSNGEDVAEAELPKLVAQLRRAGYHVRHTYRSTRNVGKLLGEADKCHSRTAIILDDKLAEGFVSIKDLASGDQRDDITRDEVETALREILSHQHDARV